MSAIRLEKFAHPIHQDVRGQLISNIEIQEIRKEAFESGIQKGAAAATAAFSTEQSRCLAEIQEAIDDSFFVREEARRAVMLSLRPFIVSLVETLAPIIGQQGLAAEIASIATNAAEMSDQPSLSVFVPVGMKPEISDMLEAFQNQIHVSEDKSLTGMQARICWDGGYDTIDMTATATTAKTAIETFFNELKQPTEMVQYGKQ